jgi:hypothetical protein
MHAPQADANNAKRRAAQDAAVQAKIDDINFDVEIGKMTKDQQIAAYEKLLKTANMGKQTKKQFKREIGGFKHEAENADESSFELGLDNIRIPTMYEVARLVKGGPGGVTTAVNNANTVNVNVNGPQDYELLGRCSSSTSRAPERRPRARPRCADAHETSSTTRRPAKTYPWPINHSDENSSARPARSTPAPTRPTPA